MSDLSKGSVMQVTGPVVDVSFEDGKLPSIYNALTMEIGERSLTVEVAQHIGDNMVRCIAMASTDGLKYLLINQIIIFGKQLSKKRTKHGLQKVVFG